MSYLPMIDYDTASQEARDAWDQHIARGGKITNMKKTLLENVPSFTAYMEWYTLYDELQPVIGDRALSLYSYSISNSNDCMICSLFFRQILIDSGDDPDHPNLSDTEKLLMDLGHNIVKNPHDIPQDIYGRLKEKFTDEQIVTLLAFAGIMYATNLFNTIAKVPLDEVLYKYRGGWEAEKEKEKNNG